MHVCYSKTYIIKEPRLVQSDLIKSRFRNTPCLLCIFHVRVFKGCLLNLVSRESIRVDLEF